MRLSLQGTIHAAGTCLCLCLPPGGLRTGGCPGRCRPGPESVTRHGMAPGPENRYHGLITTEKEEMTAMKSIYHGVGGGRLVQHCCTGFPAPLPEPYGHLSMHTALHQSWRLRNACVMDDVVTGRTDDERLSSHTLHGNSPWFRSQILETSDLKHFAVLF